MNCARIPAVSASGDSASTSDHASSAPTVVPGCLAAARPDGVGYTRRLLRPPQCVHSVWSTKGGEYDPSASGSAAAAGSGPSTAPSTSAGAATNAFTALARLAL